MFQKFDQFQIYVLKPSCGNHVHFHKGPNIGTNETWNFWGHEFKVELQLVCHMLHVHHLFFAKCVTNGKFNSTKVIKSISMLRKKKLILKFLKKIGQNTWLVTNTIRFFFHIFFFQKLQAKWERCGLKVVFKISSLRVMDLLVSTSGHLPNICHIFANGQITLWVQTKVTKSALNSH